MGRATPDANSQFTVIGASSVDGVTPIELYVNPANHAAYVELVAGTITGANGAILDGVDDGIEATVFDLTNSNPLATQIVDADGTAIVSFGGGTQYTEGDTDATITGTAIMWEDAANTLVAVSAGKPLPIEVTDASIAVTGTFWQATQPVSGTFWQATQPVSIAAAVAVTGTFWQATQPVSIAGTVTVDGSGVTQPVSGTVTANLSATDNAVLDAIALAVATEGDALGDGVLIQGDDGTDRTNILVDTDGHLQIDVLSAPSTTVTATNLDIRDLTSTDVVTVTGGAGQTADVKITLDSEAVAVTGTFWQATQPVSGTVTANAGTNLNTSTLALEAGGNLAAAATSLGLLDNSVDGNYLNVNMNIAGADVSATVPMPVRPNEFELAAVTTHVKKYYTNAGAVTDGIIWSPAAGKRWYVTDIFINVSAAATVTLEDDLAAGDSAIWKAELAANSGWSHSFNTPLYSGEDQADLLITTTAGNCYVCCTGYEI